MALKFSRSHASLSVCLQPRAIKLIKPRTSRHFRQTVHAAAASQTAPKSPYEALKGIEVIRSSDGAKVDLTTLWNDNERAVVAFARSLGCFFCWELAIQLRRDLMPKLDEKGVKLYLVSIGTEQRSHDYSQVTQFPEDRLFVDPENVTYNSLQLVKGVKETFFDWQTPVAMKERIDKQKMSDLQDILPRWQPWLPPRQDQAFQQGGMFIFEGSKVLFAHYDPSTSAHASFDEVLRLATADL